MIPRSSPPRSFPQAVASALRGIRHAAWTQRHFRAHLVIATVTLLAAAWAGLGPGELALLATVIGLVLGAELLNTAVEMLTDLFHPHEGPRAALVKDVSAAAVLGSSIIAAVVGAFVLLPHLGALSPTGSRVLAVILALVFVVALCAGFARTGRPRV